MNYQEKLPDGQHGLHEERFTKLACRQEHVYTVLTSGLLSTQDYEYEYSKDCLGTLAKVLDTLRHTTDQCESNHWPGGMM